MAGRIVHELDCLKLFGDRFVEVHKWLDQFDKTLEDHRQYRHNKDGVERIRFKFGDLAAKAAVAHILMDLGVVPENREDYLKNYSVWNEERSKQFNERRKENERNKMP